VARLGLATAPLSPLVVGVISDCTFAELWHITRKPPGGADGRSHSRWSQVGSLCWRQASDYAQICSRRTQCAGIEKIAPRPVLIMHGAADADVPVAEAHQLFHAAREPKELWLVPNATHRQIEGVAREEYRRRIVVLFERAFEMQSTVNGEQ
jgi:pimeloyl-ACP methyl ester carboxylesterase